MILEPSNGGNGKMFSANKRILMPKMWLMRPYIGNSTMEVDAKYFSGIAKINAVSRLEKGPAKAIKAPSRLGLRKFSGLKGTGFPHPIPIKISASVPKKSKCYALYYGSS